MGGTSGRGVESGGTVGSDGNGSGGVGATAGDSVTGAPGASVRGGSADVDGADVAGDAPSVVGGGVSNGRCSVPVFASAATPSVSTIAAASGSATRDSQNTRERVRELASTFVPPTPRSATLCPITHNTVVSEMPSVAAICRGERPAPNRRRTSRSVRDK